MCRNGGSDGSNAKNAAFVVTELSVVVAGTAARALTRAPISRRSTSPGDCFSYISLCLKFA